MIGLVAFLKAAGVEIDADDLKIHLACWNRRVHPIDVFFAGNFKEWQEHQGQQHFRCAQILSLIDQGQGNWLFVGVYHVLGCRSHPNHKTDFLYSTTLLPKQEEMIGRITVRHKRTRNSRIWCKPGIALPILEIRREKLTIEDFPGYNGILISHSKVKIITDQKIASWHGALANIKGIYLVTDTATGKHYVGKASGKTGIWQRWCSYAKNGHGGNKELKAVLKRKGAKYMAHFQYSVLEIADTHASDNDILERETYWMNALKSRTFGMN